MNPRILLAAALAALVSPAAASAAPVTQTSLTAPASDPTVLTYAEPSGTTLAVSGTSNGGVNLIDIRCEGSNKPLLASKVKPAATGAWTVTLPAKALQVNIGRTCYLHAVRTGNNGANHTTYPGRRLIIQGTRVTAISGGPNNGVPYDFRYTAPQLSGRGIFQSAATCGLASAGILSTTGSISQSIFNCAGFIETNTAGRAGVLVDRQNAFLAGQAANLFPGAANGLNFLALQSSLTSDPVTGSITIRETSRLMRCAPDPVAFPATAQSCSSFTNAGVQLDRTIVQQSDGRQALISDTWSSVDGNRHEVDAFYQTRLGGSAPAASFPWLGGYGVYPPGFRAAAPPTSGPFSFFVRPSLTTPDGDTQTTQGAVTLQDAPTTMQFATTGSALWTQYVRTITPQAPAKVVMAFSWAQRQADVASLAGQAQAAMGSSQCIVPSLSKRTVKKARELLAHANCALGAVRHVRSKKGLAGRVLLQLRRTGVALPAGSQVSVVVSDGKPKPPKKKK